MKNLKTMETEGLLRSDSYGLGVEKLWRITASATPESPKIKTQKQILDEFGVAETGKLSKFFYDHEVAHGWVFLAFLLSGRLKDYKRNSDPVLKDDSWLEFGREALPYFVEIEMGEHSAKRIDEKIIRYMKRYRETKTPQHVLFVEMSEAKVEERIETFERLRTTQHYQVALYDEFISNLLTARISNRFDVFDFQTLFQTPSNS